MSVDEQNPSFLFIKKTRANANGLCPCSTHIRIRNYIELEQLAIDQYNVFQDRNNKEHTHNKKQSAHERTIYKIPTYTGKYNEDASRKNGKVENKT